MRDYLNVLDIADLPPTQRKVMRFILRKVEMTYNELCDAIEALPEGERVSRADLDQVLQALMQDRWLVQTDGKEMLPSYRANLRRNVIEREPPKRERRNIWDVLTFGEEAAAKSSKKPDFGDL
jgi:hypothetical protein